MYKFRYYMRMYLFVTIFLSQMLLLIDAFFSAVNEIIIKSENLFKAITSLFIVAFGKSQP